VVRLSFVPGDRFPLCVSRTHTPRSPKGSTMLRYFFCAVFATTVLFASGSTTKADLIFSDAGGTLSVTFTDPVIYNVTGSFAEDFYHVVIRDAYTSNQPNNWSGGSGVPGASATTSLTHDQSGLSNDGSTFDSAVLDFNVPDANDLILGFRWIADVAVVSGDTFTLDAGTYSTNLVVPLPDSVAPAFDTLIIEGAAFNQATSIQTITAVPEPSSLLVMLGIGMTTLTRRRRRSPTGT